MPSDSASEKATRQRNPEWEVIKFVFLMVIGRQFVEQAHLSWPWAIMIGMAIGILGGWMLSRRRYSSTHTMAGLQRSTRCMLSVLLCLAILTPILLIWRAVWLTFVLYMNSLLVSLILTRYILVYTRLKAQEQAL